MLFAIIYNNVIGKVVLGEGNINYLCRNSNVGLNKDHDYLGLVRSKMTVLTLLQSEIFGSRAGLKPM